MNDAISRSAVLAGAEEIDWYHVNQNGKFVSGSTSDDVSYVKYDDVVHMLEDAPSLDVVPVVHARWIHCKGKSNLWYCSNCGDKMIYNPTRRTYNIVKLSMTEKNKFCRNCGARMDGEAD